uniref:Tetraspanin n=1 Tax=Panagrolaimus sp. JU765 TaxID=591449 RepID=A0AC34PXL7_9BILA
MAKFWNRVAEDGWCTVTLLSAVVYFLLLCFTLNATEIDLEVNYEGYNHQLTFLKIYILVNVLNSCCILMYQAYINELPKSLKRLLYILVVYHVFFQMYCFSIYLPALIAYAPTNAMKVTGSWIEAFNDIKYHSSRLQFLPLEEVGNFSEVGMGITGPSYSMARLEELKNEVDFVQTSFGCCGLHSYLDWKKFYSGNLTAEQDAFAPIYTWWMNSTFPEMEVPVSCCTNQNGLRCQVAVQGCLVAVLTSASVNILFLSGLLIIVGIIVVCRDVAVVRSIYNVDMEPFPIIDARKGAGSDLPRFALKTENESRV